MVVCGLGAMGSAITYQAAKRGLRVLGIDTFAPPHARGSTHGDTRVTRVAIGEGLQYVPLVRRSHHLWREIEGETGAELLTTTGVLVIASPGQHARHNGKTDFFETTIEAARTFSIDHELLSAAEIATRYPQFRLEGSERGYFEPGGGFVRPEAAVTAQLQLAARHGAVLRTGETLTGHARAGGGVTVTTSAATYSAGTLVLAVGAWIGEVLGQPLTRHFAVTRQILHWFAAGAEAAAYRADRFPVFIWDSGPLSFYGFPAIDGDHGGVKVAAESSIRIASPADVARELTGDELYTVYDTVVRHRLPGLARRCVKAVTCLYTVTPDGDFVIDSHPDDPAVLIVSPCSGHGFKHSAAIGEAVAARIAGEQPAVDLSSFSLSRFASARAS